MTTSLSPRRPTAYSEPKFGGEPMDPLSLLALTAVTIGVLAYAVYGAVRKGVRDGLKDDRERLRAEEHADQNGEMK